MATLSPRARRRDNEIDLALHERDARHVVERVESWGLPRDRRSPEGEEVALSLDNYDRADARTLAEVWAGG